MPGSGASAALVDDDVDGDDVSPTMISGVM
jgi:hypothetical protein